MTNHIKPTKWVMGNWKLNPNSLDEATTLAEALLSKLTPVLTSANQESVNDKSVNELSVRIAAAPIAVHLQAVGTVFADIDKISLMAQDVSKHESTGAYTGDVNASLLKDIGVASVLVGHSERREYYQESAETLSAKITNVLEHSMMVVYCVGEPLQVREQGTHIEYVTKQLESVLLPIKDKLTADNMVVAYEPVWAIGTGKVAEVADIEQMHAAIRRTLIDINASLGKVSILYGGSVKPENASAIANVAGVDGALVGGASLNAEHFLDIVHAFR